MSFCSLQPRGGDEGQGNGRRYGRTIEINLDDRRGVDEGVWRVSQRGRGETRSGWKAIGPKPNETRSGWKDGDFEPIDPLECLSAEMFLDQLLDEDSLAFLDILAEVTHAGGKATPDGEEGPGRGADELSVSFSLKTDCAVRGDSDADSDPGGAAEEDILDRWEEWILFVAVDVVSGLQMVIPARYVRLAAIPWHVLLPGDPLCLPKDYVVLGRKRVLTSAARGSDSLSSTLSESRRLAKAGRVLFVMNIPVGLPVIQSQPSLPSSFSSISSSISSSLPSLLSSSSPSFSTTTSSITTTSAVAPKPPPHFLDSLPPLGHLHLPPSLHLFLHLTVASRTSGDGEEAPWSPQTRSRKSTQEL